MGRKKSNKRARVSISGRTRRNNHRSPRRTSDEFKGARPKGKVGEGVGGVLSNRPRSHTSRNLSTAGDTGCVIARQGVAAATTTQVLVLQHQPTLITSLWSRLIEQRAIEVAIAASVLGADTPGSALT